MLNRPVEVAFQQSVTLAWGEGARNKTAFEGAACKGASLLRVLDQSRQV